jgi:hypothetical protein
VTQYVILQQQEDGAYRLVAALEAGGQDSACKAYRDSQALSLEAAQQGISLSAVPLRSWDPRRYYGTFTWSSEPVRDGLPTAEDDLPMGGVATGAHGPDKLLPTTPTNEEEREDLEAAEMPFVPEAVEPLTPMAAHQPAADDDIAMGGAADDAPLQLLDVAAGPPVTEAEADEIIGSTQAATAAMFDDDIPAVGDRL